MISADYFADAVKGTKANPGYGYTFWTNAGDRYGNTSVPSPQFFNRRVGEGLPRDAFAMSGALGQLVVVVPSFDIVIVRTGLPPLSSGVSDIFASSSNLDLKEFFQRVIESATDKKNPAHVDFAKRRARKSPPSDMRR